MLFSKGPFVQRGLARSDWGIVLLSNKVTDNPSVFACGKSTSLYTKEAKVTTETPLLHLSVGGFAQIPSIDNSFSP